MNGLKAEHVHAFDLIHVIFWSLIGAESASIYVSLAWLLYQSQATSGAKNPSSREKDLFTEVPEGRLVHLLIMRTWSKGSLRVMKGRSKYCNWGEWRSSRRAENSQKNLRLETKCYQIDCLQNKTGLIQSDILCMGSMRRILMGDTSR